MKKPRVFIGSSMEGLPVAKAVEVDLNDETEPVLWKRVFDPSKTTIENLEQNLDTVEFAVLVVTPDDRRMKREKTTDVPRDNVVFELGLYMGRLGRDRTFLVKVEGGSDPQLPTDLLGVTVISVDSTRSDGDMVAAVSPKLYDLKQAIKKAPRRQPVEDRSGYRNILLDEDQFLNAIAAWPRSSKAITIALPNTTWAWQLFPALLCWRLTKTPVLVYTLQPLGDSTEILKEQARRRLLGNLGVHVEQVENIEKAGIFRRANIPEENCVIICNERGARDLPFAIQYDGTIHGQATLSLMKEMVPQSGKADTSCVPQLKGYDVKDVIARLRAGVDQYSSPGVVLEVSTLSTNDLYLMTPFVRSYKYRQIELLYNQYPVGVTPFQAMAVWFTSGEYSIVIPPIVEIHDNMPIVIGGTTRAKFCRDRGIPEVHCIQVTGVHDPLPFTPVPIDKASVAERFLEPSQRMKDFDYSHFRHIESAVRPY